MTAFADHGPGGSGEPLAIVLRPGNAGSNTAADQVEAARLALAQLPRHLRRKALICADSAGGTHEFLKWVTGRSRRLHYSVGFTITADVQEAIGNVPDAGRAPAYDGDGEVRDGAWVADITGMLDLSSWPAEMRVIVRKERPHPGAQLRFTDIDGHRFTALATDEKGGQLAGLELRHRRRARCEDRCAKDTGLRNLPLKGHAQNQIWCEIFALARRWELKRLRLRIFSVAGRLVRGGRRLRLRLAEHWPWERRSPPRLPCSRPSHPADQPEPSHHREGGNYQGPWTPTRRSRHLRPADQGRERSRLS
jgi:hypothetical protein